MTTTSNENALDLSSSGGEGGSGFASGLAGGVGGAGGPAPFLYPCMEQPTRVALHCNGYYLWGCRNGKLVARKRRASNDEFRIHYNDSSDGSAVAKIHNHRFQRILSVVEQPDGTRQVWCVKEGNDNDDDNDDDKYEEDDDKYEEDDDNDDDNKGKDNNIDENVQEQTIKQKEKESEDASTSNTGTEVAASAVNPSTRTENEEDRNWCFFEGKFDGGTTTKVKLQCLRTFEHLAIDARGNVVLVSPEEISDVSNPNSSSSNNNNNSLWIWWDIECVTGELCYLSSPSTDLRLRCDMAGLLSLTKAWKGWEVFRILETNHGYVKISSWMHSQWMLCSDVQGNCTTCSHAESFHDINSSNSSSSSSSSNSKSNTSVASALPTTSLQNTKCSKWAVEKSQDGTGVVLRSKTFGRYLCINGEGQLRTIAEPKSATKQKQKFQDELVQREDEQNKESTIMRTTDSIHNNNPNNNDNWTSSWRNQMDQMRKSLSNVNLSSPPSSTAQIYPPVSETMIWQLESAHLQTYYFLNFDASSSTKKKKKPKQPQALSVGPFPEVTPNLRKTDKIRLVRNPNNGGSGESDKENLAKLYLLDLKQYISCIDQNGTIALVDEALMDSSHGTDWILEKSTSTQGGNVFRNKRFGFYLSYRYEENEDESESPGDYDNDSNRDEQHNARDDDGDNNTAASKNATAKWWNQSMNSMRNSMRQVTASTRSTKENYESEAGDSHHGIANPFASKPERVGRLIGSKSKEQRSVWNLDPSMPRAISSEKIKTFALGTSIAVGTTIAMPFALAGVGFALGAVGAEVGVVANVIFAGLTGAEALASVGAIGATAYIVFRPAENSLTDKHENEKEKMETAWSKRPFSNWRNW